MILLCYVCKGALRRETGGGRDGYWYSLGKVPVPEGVASLVCTKCHESWIDPDGIETYREGMRKAYGDPVKPIWTAAKVLRRAKVRVKAGWVQEHLAVDEHGVVVTPREATAVCYSLAAAIGGGCTMSPTEGRSENEAREICESILRNRERRNGGWLRVDLHVWNDDKRRLQRDVLQLLDEAIEEAEDREYVPGRYEWPS